jgi:LPPG:FO 2-phospho-L-lactate transferase
MLKTYGVDAWFNLGDRDLATHIYRTNCLKKGIPLSQITDEIRRSLGVKAKIVPMSNDKFETKITTPKGTMHFEEFFVKNQCRDEVLGVEFAGAASAKPSPGVLEAILDAEIVVVCPSNPIVSIGTILSVDGVRDALQRTNARVVAVSPIVAGAAIKGPADKMLRGLGFEVSAFAVAKLYGDFLDAFVIDSKDAAQKERIEMLGVAVAVTDTIMRGLEDKLSLANVVLEC